MINKKIIVASTLLGLGMVGSAYASPFTFNPCGGSSNCSVTGQVFDEAPGNVLAVNAVNPNGPLAVGTVVTDYYQANLAAVESGSNSQVLYANGGNGAYFTIVGAFQEVVTSDSNGVLTFALAPGGTTNYFQIFENSTPGNNSTGVGFGAGTQILSATLTSATSSFIASTCPNGGATAPLNSTGDGAYGSNIQTICGNGAATLDLTVNSVNGSYFPGLATGATMVTSTTNSSLITPYTTVDPSSAFYDGSSFLLASDVGSVNGVTGPNFQFLADANSTFTTTSAVPEPATLALFALGLFGLGCFRRRNQA